MSSSRSSGLSILFLVAFASSVNGLSKSYANCVDITDKVQGRLYWTVNGSSINFAMEAATPKGYFAVGLSSGQTMVGVPFSDAWMLGSNNATNDKCKGGCVADLMIKSKSGPIWDTQDDCENTKVGQNSTHIWGEFTRKLVTSDSSNDRPLYTNQSQYLIWAAHPTSGDLLYGKPLTRSHKFSSSFLINFGTSSKCNFATTTTTTGVKTTTTTGSAVSTSTGKDTVTSTGSATSTSGTVTGSPKRLITQTVGINPTKNSYALSNSMTLFWEVDTADAVAHFKLVGKTSGWVGMGFRPDMISQMAYTDIIVGWVDDTTKEVILIDSNANEGNSMPSSDDKIGGTYDVALTNGTQENGVTTIIFRRFIQTGDKFDVDVFSNGTAQLILWGMSNTDGTGSQSSGEDLSYDVHTARGSHSINFMAQTNNTASSTSASITSANVVATEAPIAGATNIAALTLLVVFMLLASL